MVVPGHDGGPAEPLDRPRDSTIVRSHENPFHQRGLLDPTVNVLDQRLSVDFDQCFSGETGGIESGGDDRDGGVDLHQNTALDLSTPMTDIGGPLLAEKMHPERLQVCLNFFEKGELIELHSGRAHQYNGAT